MHMHYYVFQSLEMSPFSCDLLQKQWGICSALTQLTITYMFLYNAWFLDGRHQNFILLSIII